MRWVWLVIGALAVLSGIVWTLQGLDLLGQSGGMNGVKMWAVIGPITTVAGLILIGTGLRKRNP